MDRVTWQSGRGVLANVLEITEGEESVLPDIERAEYAKNHPTSVPHQYSCIKGGGTLRLTDFVGSSIMIFSPRVRETSSLSRLWICATARPVRTSTARRTIWAERKYLVDQKMVQNDIPTLMAGM